MRRRAFTLIELIVVTVIIVLLASLAIFGVYQLRARARLGRVSTELTRISTAAAEYAQDNNNLYPADADHTLPAGLLSYLAGNQQPTSAWPKGYFDWDNWTTVGGVSVPQVVQVSYRLCQSTDPASYCSDPVLFPHFTSTSAIFYCIQGSCVPYYTAPTSPGYCVNCTTKPVNPPL